MTCILPSYCNTVRVIVCYSRGAIWRKKLSNNFIINHLFQDQIETTSECSTFSEEISHSNIKKSNIIMGSIAWGIFADSTYFEYYQTWQMDKLQQNISISTIDQENENVQ